MYFSVTTIFERRNPELGRTFDFTNIVRTVRDESRTSEHCHITLLILQPSRVGHHHRDGRLGRDEVGAVRDARAGLAHRLWHHLEGAALLGEGHLVHGE